MSNLQFLFVFFFIQNIAHSIEIATKKTITKLSNSESEELCFYPFTTLFKLPNTVTVFKPTCLIERNEFELISSYETENIQINIQNGFLTIKPFQTDVDVIHLTIFAYLLKEKVEMELTIFPRDILYLNGFSYFYNATERHQCGTPSEEVISHVEGNCYVDSFLGIDNTYEFTRFFPSCRYTIFSMHYSWNSTIQVDGNYTFFFSVYDDGNLYFNNQLVTNGSDICSDKMVTLNSTIYLTSGVYPMNFTMKTSLNTPEPTIFHISYLPPNSNTEKAIPMNITDITFDPITDLHTDETEYNLLQLNQITIRFKSEAYAIACWVEPELPKGLNFEYMQIYGKPTVLQSAKLYAFQCNNSHSISNKWFLKISVNNNLRPGLRAYYTKNANFSQNCFDIYEPGSLGTKTYIGRYENTIDHTTVDKHNKFVGLPMEFCGEYSVVMVGYIKFVTDGRYEFRTEWSDTLAFYIGGQGSSMAKCTGIRPSSMFLQLESGMYSIYIGYTNNYNDPHFTFKALLNKTEVFPELLYDYHNEIEYEFFEVIYNFNETITENHLITSLKDSIISIIVAPPLCEGLEMNHTDGTIYGKPLVNNLLPTKYFITFTLSNSLTYHTTIVIEVQTSHFVEQFYVHDLLTGQNQYGTFLLKKEQDFNFEVLSLDGNTDRMVLVSFLPPKIYSENSKNRIRIYGQTQSIHLLTLTFKAYVGSVVTVNTLPIEFLPSCSEDQALHHFFYSSQINQTEATIQLFSNDSSFTKRIQLGTNIPSVSICLRPNFYHFTVNPLFTFQLDCNVHGVAVFSETFYSSFESNRLLSTIESIASMIYNNDEPIEIPIYKHIHLIPKITGYTYDKSISLIPDEINFDPITGIISGYFTSEKSLSLVIYYYDASGEAYTTEIDFIITNNKKYDCYHEKFVFISFQFNLKYQTENNLTLSLVDNNNLEIFNLDVSLIHDHDFMDGVCLDISIYTIRLFDLSNNTKGWNNSVNISVNDVVIGTFSIKPQEYQKSIPLDLENYYHSLIKWNYNYNFIPNYYSREVEVKWNSAQFENITTTTTNTTYLRSLFELTKKTPPSAIHIQFSYLSGIILYVDGEEIFRKNVKDGSLNEYDEASNCHKENQIVDFILPIDKFRYNTTLIAIELHKYATEVKYPEFNLSIIFLGDYNITSNHNSRSITVNEISYPILNKVFTTHFITGLIYKSTPLVSVLGNDLHYSIFPILPPELFFYTCNGSFAGEMVTDFHSRFTLTVFNQFGSINIPIYFSFLSSSQPLFVYVPPSVDLHYGIYYQFLKLWNIFGKNIRFTNLLPNPSNLTLDITGIFHGRLTPIVRTEKISILAQTNESTTAFNVSLRITEPLHPTVLSFNSTVAITIGETVSDLCFFNVSGQNNYSISNLPIGLFVNSSNGFINGRLLQIIPDRNCTITATNDIFSTQFDVALHFNLPTIPILIEAPESIEFINHVTIQPFLLVIAVGSNLRYKVTPDLPSNIHFIESNAMVYGEPTSSSNGNYTLTVYNNNVTLYHIFSITVTSIYCQYDVKWGSQVEVGVNVTYVCAAQGREYRSCLFQDGKAIWSDVTGKCHGITTSGIVLLVLVCVLFVAGFTVSTAYYIYINKINQEKNNLINEPLL